MQLAITDSILLLTLPFKVTEDLNHGWIYPEWMCKAKETILFLNYYASILFLMVITFVDFMGIFQKTKSIKNLSCLINHWLKYVSSWMILNYQAYQIRLKTDLKRALCCENVTNKDILSSYKLLQLLYKFLLPSTEREKNNYNCHCIVVTLLLQNDSAIFQRSLIVSQV